MDLSRLGDWFIATSAYRRGDARKLSKFIETHGVLVGIESKELAALLLSKPDTRKETKPETLEMLRYVRSEMLRREELKSASQHHNEHIEKVSMRLKQKGLSTERIANSFAKEMNGQLILLWKLGSLTQTRRYLLGLQ